MSQSLPAAADIDWKLVASALAVFFGTVVTTVWGWMQGRKKAKDPAPDTAQFHIAGATLQDNTSLRDNTHAVRDLRDQIMFLRDCMERRLRSEDELKDSLDDLIKRLDKVG